MSPRRYALYFAPEDGSALATFGWTWLGRAPHDTQSRPLPDLGFATDRHAQIIADARRYGFHATLKPPFRLAAGLSEAELCNDIAAFAAQHVPFSEPPPVLVALDGFLALCPAQPSAAIHALADACVRRFDRFRAPAPAAETAKRLSAPLSERQRQAVADWGYPYVFADYRFHMTLTCRLSEGEREPWQAAAEREWRRHPQQPMDFASICLFTQASPDAPFVLARRFRLGDRFG